MLLEVNHIDTYYGKIQALNDVSIRLDAGQIVSVIGANGAGKTTLMSSIVALTPISKGSIIYKGEDISDMKTHEIVARRITYVPEGRRIFPKLSVRENLEMGAYSRRGVTKTELKNNFEEMYDMFPRLRERQNQMGGTLSGGEQQMLAIARGLMNRPEVLILDEPSLGLAPIIVDDMFAIITRINKELNMPILLVEQNAFMAMEISNYTYVLENGIIGASGPSCELINDESITKAYLGG